MNPRLIAGVFASALISTISVPAMATAPVGDPLAGLQAMRELNAIVLGDAQGWLTVEGKTHIGGSLSGGGKFGTGNASQGAAASDRATLTVGKNVSGSVINVANGSNGGKGRVGSPASVAVGGNLSGIEFSTDNAVVKVAGTLSNSVSSSGSILESGGAGSGYLTGSGTYATGKGGAYAGQLSGGISDETAHLNADLKALSLSLASQGTTAGNSITDNYGARTLNAVAGANGMSVFTLSEADLNGWRFTLNVADPATTVIFNISGDKSYDWNTTLAGAFGADFAGNVIWNFSDATSVNVSQAVYGSILAPWAQVGANSIVNGTVVADGLRASSGVAMGGYDGGSLYLDANEAVPEPATWAMLILGFGMIGATMRRRRATPVRTIFA